MKLIRRDVLTGLAAGLGLLTGACSEPYMTPSENATTIVYLVRHAEKTTEQTDPGLTDTGKARAEALADRLEGAGLTAVWSTDTTRTRDTAAPIAARLGLEIEPYGGHELIATAERLRMMPGRILVVGHSNTTPVLTDLLGGDMVGPIDEAGEYDRLYVVTLGADGSVTSDLQRYGVRYVPESTDVEGQ